MRTKTNKMRNIMSNGIIKKIRYWLGSISYKILFILVILVCSMGSFPQTTLAAFPTGWSYYQVITLPAVKNISSFPYLLTNLPAEVYTHARSDGGDIHFTTSDGATELAREIVSFNAGANTAEIWVLVPTLTVIGTNNIRIYYGAANETEPAANSTYGSQAVWTNYAGVYHLKEAVNTDAGGYKDSTANANNMTGVSMAMPATAGQIGTSAEFDGTADYLLSTTMPASNYPLSVSGWMWLNNETGRHTLAGLGKADSAETRQDVVAWGETSVPNDPILAYSRNVNTYGFAQKTDFPASSWIYAAGVFTSSASRTAFLNGVGGVEETSAVTWTTYDAFTIGVHKGSSNTGFASGKIDEIHVSASVRSSDWLYAEYWTGVNQTAPTYGGELSTNPAGNPSAPTLISPANSSFTADNTPTLSSRYIDDDSVGTTNYRIASTNANDCLSGANLVASGSSIETTTTNEATSFTPGSSIGSDATYYWCAQNVNGVNTSDWTTMGSLTLDKTNPSIPGTPTTTSNTVDSTPTWTWTASSDGGSGLHLTTPYTVEWSQDTNFVSGVFTSTSGTNSFTHTDSLANGTWYFRVSAKDAVNNESAFSANGSILINTNASTLQVTYVSTTNGVKSYDISSDRNGNGTHSLRVLEPDNPAAGVAHSFLYVLPVEAELNTVFGDGLETLRLLDAQNQYNITIIAPSFDIMPWYADHATDSNYRYETFMSLELQPWVKANLATTGNEQHWLLGFSKSGYGPMSLFLKHPDLFTLGAFWDFPANMSDYTSYSANTNYGTQANFDNNYRLTSTFLENNKTHFLSDNRIWINGYGLFRTDMQNFDTLLTTKSIQHTTAAEVSRAHNWTSGWVPSALAGLYANSIIASTEITTTDSGTDTSWHNANVTVTLTCNDNSGSGCAHTYYTTDGTTPDTSSSQGTSVVVSTNGSHTIKYFSINNIGQQEAVKTAANIVKIDKQNPTISAGEDQSKGAIFTQVATASDSGSDINASTYQWAKVSGPGLITFENDTALSTTISADTNGTYVISFTASDNAGNSNSDNFTLIWYVAPTTYTITASAGSHGSISPSGATTVNSGDNQQFSLTADSGYHISDVVVDGSSVGAVSSYTFSNVTADHTISVTFAVTSGGGGGCYNCYVNPSIPSGGFKMSINGGASTTSSRNVFLGFNAGTDIKKMAISMTGDFTDASQENYVASRQWDLCSKLGGIVKNPTCPDGTYKIYAQFYTAYGRTTGNAFASSTITLKSGSTTTENLQQYTNLPFSNLFTKYLQYRQTNADIKRLQIFLNADPDTKIADTGAGSPGKETNYFGFLTYKAVIKFQEKYAKDILAPWGFKKGTGYVGKTTLAKINELMKSK